MIFATVWHLYLTYDVFFRNFSGKDTMKKTRVSFKIKLEQLTPVLRIVSRFRDKKYELFRCSRPKNVNKQQKKLSKKERKSKLYNFLQIEEKCGVVSV